MRERIFKFVGLAVIAGSFSLGWLWMEYQSFLETSLTLNAQEQSFSVEPGSSLHSVAAKLQREGLIKDARMFRWMARLSGDAQRIQAGEYLLRENMKAPQLLQEMVQGKVRQYSLTLIEGRNFREMMQEVNSNPYLKHTLKGFSDSDIMAAIGYAGEHPEGRFLPETYSFPRGMSDVEFLRRAYQALSERLAYEWENREEGLPYKTPYDALILASIVEKETGQKSERPEIAGIFIRRLKKGMRLQTDPTVIYGMGLDFDGNLRKRDLLRDTPYNSYTRAGLPPTPIAMAGAEAIHAAMHPDKSDNLYFVAKGDGSHHFSATLEEHNRAVIKYQRNGRRSDYTSSPTSQQ